MLLLVLIASATEPLHFDGAGPIFQASTLERASSEARTVLVARVREVQDAVWHGGAGDQRGQLTTVDILDSFRGGVESGTVYYRNTNESLQPGQRVLLFAGPKVQQAKDYHPVVRGFLEGLPPFSDTIVPYWSTSIVADDLPQLSEVAEWPVGASDFCYDLLEDGRAMARIHPPSSCPESSHQGRESPPTDSALCTQSRGAGVRAQRIPIRRLGVARHRGGGGRVLAEMAMTLLLAFPALALASDPVYIGAPAPISDVATLAQLAGAAPMVLVATVSAREEGVVWHGGAGDIHGTRLKLTVQDCLRGGVTSNVVYLWTDLVTSPGQRLVVFGGPKVQQFDRYFLVERARFTDLPAFADTIIPYADAAVVRDDFPSLKTTAAWDPGYSGLCFDSDVEDFVRVSERNAEGDLCTDEQWEGLVDAVRAMVLESRDTTAIVMPGVDE